MDKQTTGRTSVKNTIIKRVQTSHNSPSFAINTIIFCAFEIPLLWQAHFPLWYALVNANQMISCSASTAYCSGTWHITSRIEWNAVHILHIGAVHACTCQRIPITRDVNHHDMHLYRIHTCNGGMRKPRVRALYLYPSYIPLVLINKIKLTQNF